MEGRFPVYLSVYVHVYVPLQKWGINRALWFMSLNKQSSAAYLHLQQTTTERGIISLISNKYQKCLLVSVARLLPVPGLIRSN